MKLIEKVSPATRLMRQAVKDPTYIKLGEDFLALPESLRQASLSPEQRSETLSHCYAVRDDITAFLRKFRLSDFQSKVSKLRGNDSKAWALIRRAPISNPMRNRYKKKTNNDNENTTTNNNNNIGLPPQNQAPTPAAPMTSATPPAIDDEVLMEDKATTMKCKSAHRLAREEKKRNNANRKKLSRDAADPVANSDNDSQHHQRQAHGQTPPPGYDHRSQIDDYGPKAMSSRFADQYYKISTRDKNSPRGLARRALLAKWRDENQQHPDRAAQVNRQKCKPVDMAELRSAIRATPHGKASGEDNLHAETLSRLPKCTLKAICDLIDQSLRTGRVPKGWRRQLIIPLPKPGKDHSLLSSYRPVSLTSVLCKVAERIVSRRLAWYMNESLTDRQSGYRPGRRTSDQLAHAFAFVQKARQKLRENSKQSTNIAAVLVDFSRAFDKVDHRIVIDIMEKHGFPRYLTLWINGFLRNR